MPDQVTYYANSDEIDLQELLLGIWDGKWILAGTLALGLGLGAVASLLLSDRFSFSLEIRPITISQHDAYGELNSLGFSRVSRPELLSLFIENLEQRHRLVQAFDQVRYLDAEDFLDNEQYRAELQKLAFELEIIPPESEAPQSGPRRRFWELSGLGQNEAMFREALALAFGAIERDVQEVLRQKFHTQVARAERQRSFTIADTNRAIENARAEYRIGIADRLEFLREQAEIARRLGLASISLGTLQTSETRQEVGIVQNEIPFFARGFEAIEQEIENLENREFDDGFVPGLRALEAQIRRAEQDPNIERAVTAFENTPIATDAEFQAVQIELARMNVEPEFRALMIMGLAGVLGLMVGFGVLLVRSALGRGKLHNLPEGDIGIS